MDVSMENLVFDEMVRRLSGLHVLQFESVSWSGNVPAFKASTENIGRELYLWCYEGGLRKRVMWNALSVVLPGSQEA